MPRWVFSLVQFFPLSLFATLAYANGPPSEGHWRRAFVVAAVAGLVQLAIVLPQSRPVNRLVLAANLYLILGGLAFLFHQGWYLRGYDALRESAIFVAMLAVGAGATAFTPAGFAALENAARPAALRASWWLLGTTLLALGMSVMFRGDRYLAAVIPIVALAVLQRVLVRHARAGRASPLAVQ